MNGDYNNLCAVWIVNIELLLQSVKPPRFNQDNLDLEAWHPNPACP